MSGRVAEAKSSSRPVARRASENVLSRKCGCSAGRETDQVLSRATQQGPGSSAVPASVGDVMRSAGESMDPGTRTSMESAFGHDFSKVRIHADERAADSAREVGALAYTVGRHIVFGEGQYAPGSSAGRQILAHELAHSVQSPSGDALPTRVSEPGEELEREAGAVADRVIGGGGVGPAGAPRPGADGGLFRLVGRLGCTAGTASAPADPRAELTNIDGQARTMAQQLSTDLGAEATTVTGGIPATPSATLQSFIDHFGLPPAAGRGFLNRLTGTVRATQETALSEELRIVSRRFGMVARILGQPIHYACGAGAINLGSGCADNCSSNDFDAFTCRGVSGIGLCPSFWTGYADNTARAAIIIHEMLHMIFGPTSPRGIGQIGDETQRGAGRNFNVSGCYEFIVDDVFGTNSGADCPAVP